MSVFNYKNKTSWQVKSYANTEHFFFAVSPKYSGMRTKRIPLTYSSQLKDSSIFGMNKHGLTLITTQDIVL